MLARILLILFSFSLIGSVSAEVNLPEVALKKAPLSGSENEKLFNNAINQMSFVTKYPKSDDLKLVYTNIGGYKLTMDRFIYAIKSQFNECKRISAYSNTDISNQCRYIIASSIDNFSKMKNDAEISDVTKRSALYEASRGGFIDFDHAARLAFMHKKMCEEKNNKGYVQLDRLAVPCGAKGDSIDAEVARGIGMIQ